jgi:hypothetical protein
MLMIYFIPDAPLIHLSFLDAYGIDAADVLLPESY